MNSLTCFPSCLPQNVLKKRDQVQAEYEAKLEAVALRKEDRPKVREGPWGGWALGAACCNHLAGAPWILSRDTRRTKVLRASRAVLTLYPPFVPFKLYFWEFLMCTGG